MSTVPNLEGGGKNFVPVAFENQNGLFLHLPLFKPLGSALGSPASRFGVGCLRDTHRGAAGSKGSWYRGLASAPSASRLPVALLLSLSGLGHINPSSEG